MVGIRRAYRRARLPTYQRLTAHQPRHALLTDAKSVVAQIPQHAWCAIRAVTRRVREANVEHQAFVGDGARAGRAAGAPRVIAGGRHVEDAAHESHGILAAVASNAGVPQSDSSKKNAAAFFRTHAPGAGSHSPGAIAGSPLPPSRQATDPVLAPPPPPSSFRAQSHSNAGPMPSSRPIWLRLTPSARRRRINDTASALNSALNVRFARGGAGTDFPDDRFTEHLRINYGEVSTKAGLLQ